ncbi:MAG: hypothetical protein WC928_01680 [Patescibacteria group bacterium]|jgi:hypothetical protein
MRHGTQLEINFSDQKKISIEEKKNLVINVKGEAEEEVLNYLPNDLVDNLKSKERAIIAPNQDNQDDNKDLYLPHWKEQEENRIARINELEMGSFKIIAYMAKDFKVRLLALSNLDKYDYKKIIKIANNEKIRNKVLAEQIYSNFGSLKRLGKCFRLLKNKEYKKLLDYFSEMKKAETNASNEILVFDKFIELLNNVKELEKLRLA